MHETNLIFTLTGALAAGLIFGYLTNALKLSPIVGYLLAGIAVGPFTPGFIADQHIAHQLAEIGVMLLMFGVGLHFHLEDLLAVRRIAVPGAVAQIAAATGLGALIALYFGWNISAAIVYGLCLSVASTVVLTRILVDNGQLHTPTGHVAVGWLIVEDLFTVLVLVVLPLLFAQEAAGLELIKAFGILALKLIGLAVVTALLGAKVVPWVFSKVAETSSKELFTLTVLVTALGIAVASSVLFDVSMALGAFLAGMVVGKSEFSLRAASEALPLRDAFAVLFFVSVGMLLDPVALLQQWDLIALTLLAVVVGKTIAAFSLVVLLGYPISVALGVSFALAQIGEFSFILAYLAKQLKILDDQAINALVATAIVSITINPMLFRLIPRIERGIMAKPWLARLLTKRLRQQLHEASLPQGEVLAGDPRPKAVVVGYGPVGKSVCQIMRAHHIHVTVIELNLETTRRLKEQGISVVYGDAARRETLEKAGLENARVLVLSASTKSAVQEIVKEARALNPLIHVFARTDFVSELNELRDSGCKAVFSGEGEVGMALIAEVLRDIGSTPEEVERVKAELRLELTGVRAAL